MVGLDDSRGTPWYSANLTVEKPFTMHGWGSIAVFLLSVVLGATVSSVGCRSASVVWLGFRNESHREVQLLDVSGLAGPGIEGVMPAGVAWTQLVALPDLPPLVGIHWRHGGSDEERAAEFAVPTGAAWSDGSQVSFIYGDDGMWRMEIEHQGIKGPTEDQMR